MASLSAKARTKIKASMSLNPAANSPKPITRQVTVTKSNISPIQAAAHGIQSYKGRVSTGGPLRANRNNY